MAHMPIDDDQALIDAAKDVIDRDVTDPALAAAILAYPTATQTRLQAAHALAFRRAWMSALGTVPSACDHVEYAASMGGNAQGHLDAKSFAGFLRTRRGVTPPVPPDGLRAYTARLLEDDSNFLVNEIKTKLEQRYGRAGTSQALADFHAEVSGRSAGFGSHDDLMDRSPATGHGLPRSVPDEVRSFARRVGRLDAVRYSVARDYMLQSIAAANGSRIVAILGKVPERVAAEAVESAASTTPAGALVVANFDPASIGVHALRLTLDDPAVIESVPRLFSRQTVVDATDGCVAPCLPRTRVPGGCLWLPLPSDDAACPPSPPADETVALGTRDPCADPERTVFLPDGMTEGMRRLAWISACRHRLPSLSRVAADGELQHVQHCLRRHAVLGGSGSGSLLRAARQEESDGAVVVADNRPSEAAATALAAWTALSCLSGRWAVVAFASRGDAAEALRRELPEGSEIFETDALPALCFGIECYNSFMKRPDTWSSVVAPRALLVQSDGTLLRPGLESSDAYLRGWEYVGAPWRSGQPYLQSVTGNNMVGNGGFSLRDPRACERVCRGEEQDQQEEEEKEDKPRPALRPFELYPMAPRMTVAEDVLFSANLGRRVAPADQAAAFSMEQIWTPDALGHHRFWAYHHVDLVIERFRFLWNEFLQS